jgi:hypothetical protein
MSVFIGKKLDENDERIIERVVKEMENVAKFYDLEDVVEIVLSRRPMGFRPLKKLLDYSQTESYNIYEQIVKQVIYLVPNLLDSNLIPPVRKLNRNIIDSILSGIDNSEIIYEIIKRVYGVERMYRDLIYHLQSNARKLYRTKRSKEYRIKNRERIKQRRNDPINPLDVDIILFIQQLKLDEDYIDETKEIMLKDELDKVYEKMKQEIFKIDNMKFLDEYIGFNNDDMHHYTSNYTYDDFKSRRFSTILKGGICEFNDKLVIKYVTNQMCKQLSKQYPHLIRRQPSEIIRLDITHEPTNGVYLLIRYITLIWKQYENKIIYEYGPATVVRYRKFIRECIVNRFRIEGYRYHYGYIKGLFERFESLDFVVHLIRYFKSEEVE